MFFTKNFTGTSLAICTSNGYQSLFGQSGATTIASSTLSSLILRRVFSIMLSGGKAYTDSPAHFWARALGAVASLQRCLLYHSGSL